MKKNLILGGISTNHHKKLTKIRIAEKKTEQTDLVVVEWLEEGAPVGGGGRGRLDGQRVARLQRQRRLGADAAAVAARRVDAARTAHALTVDEAQVEGVGAARRQQAGDGAPQAGRGHQTGQLQDARVARQTPRLAAWNTMEHSVRDAGTLLVPKLGN